MCFTFVVHFSPYLLGALKEVEMTVNIGPTIMVNGLIVMRVGMRYKRGAEISAIRADETSEKKIYMAKA